MHARHSSPLGRVASRGLHFGGGRGGKVRVIGQSPCASHAPDRGRLELAEDPANESACNAAFADACVAQDDQFDFLGVAISHGSRVAEPQAVGPKAASCSVAHILEKITSATGGAPSSRLAMAAAAAAALPEGVEESQIASMMSGSSLSRERAVELLAKHKGNVVDALLEAADAAEEEQDSDDEAPGACYAERLRICHARRWHSQQHYLSSAIVGCVCSEWALPTG